MKKTSLLLGALTLTGCLSFTACSNKAASPKPNDAQISKVVSTVNEGEIKLAEYVLKNSQNAKVKEFASHMIKDHSMNQNLTLQLNEKNKITPAESPKSLALVRDNQLSQEALMKLKGRELDKAYIDDQVTTHTNVLNDLKMLESMAKNDALEDHIEMTQKKVEEHLKHAKEIQATL